jgi:UDP-2-acetamido-2,6-beta-L-arabino-hexul-4-ose reductase
MRIRIKKLKELKDSRGSFIEILRSEDTGKHSFGQISLTTAKSGETKGLHFHLRKREWYCVLQGKAKVVFSDNKTHKSKSVSLDDKHLQVIEMPIGVMHSITNTGKKTLMVLVYITEPYNAKTADTYTV